MKWLAAALSLIVAALLVLLWLRLGVRLRWPGGLMLAALLVALAVSVTGLSCTAPSRTGVNVTLRNSEGGVSLASLAIDRPANYIFPALY